MLRTTTVLGRIIGRAKEIFAERQDVVVSPNLSAPRYMADTAAFSIKYAAVASTRRYWGIMRSLVWVGLLFSPTILGIIYFGLVAAPRYVSEAAFIVRTAARPVGSLTGVSALLQMTGLNRSQDDVFAVHDYLMSRDALLELLRSVDMRVIYDRPEADFVAHYPSLLFGGSVEEFYRYFQWVLDVNYNGETGITSLRVEAFRAEDAHTVAESLLKASEALVNHMNERLQQDAIMVAAKEVTRGESRLTDAQVAITNFRNQELMIDPVNSSQAVSGLIGKLTSYLTETRTQIKEMTLSSPGNPQIGSFERRADALAAQIQQEKERISGSSGGLASKMETYERLVLEREFAKSALTSATGALETARSEARRQQLFLERIVQPSLPDYPMRPQRLRSMATIFGLNVTFLLVIWLVVTGIREHAQAAR